MHGFLDVQERRDSAHTSVRSKQGGPDSLTPGLAQLPKSFAPIFEKNPGSWDGSTICLHLFRRK